MANKKEERTPVPQRVVTDPLWPLPPAEPKPEPPRASAGEAEQQLAATETMSVEELRAIGVTTDAQPEEAHPPAGDAPNSAPADAASDNLAGAPTEILPPSPDARTELLTQPPAAIPAPPAASGIAAAAKAMRTKALPPRASNAGRHLLWMVVAGCALSGAGVGLLLGPRWGALATQRPPPLAAGGTLQTAGWSARLLGAEVLEQGRAVSLRFAVRRADDAPDPADLRVQLLHQGHPIDARFWSDETAEGRGERHIRFVFHPPRPLPRRVALRFAPRGAPAVKATVALSMGN